MTANQSGECVVVPREPTPSILSAMDAHSDYLSEIDGVDLIGMYAAIVSVVDRERTTNLVVDHETDSGDPQAAPSPAAGSGEAVAWRKMAERRPEAGHKFVALFDDGSGAWLGFAHDAGVIDSDGDDYTKMPNAEWWAYLPSGFRLACEDHPTEDYNLPDHVCPPLYAAPPAPSADGHDAGVVGDLVEALKRIGTVDMGGGFLGALACRQVANAALAKYATHQAAITTDTQGEGEPDETVRDQSPAIDTQDLRDLISEAIGDSMDMDWTYSDGARSIIRAFEREGLVVMESGASKAAPDASGYIAPVNTSPEPVSETPENEQVDS